MKKYLLLSIPFLVRAILSVLQASVTCNIALNNRVIDLGNTSIFTGKPETYHIAATNGDYISANGILSKQPHHPNHKTIK